MPHDTPKNELQAGGVFYPFEAALRNLDWETAVKVTLYVLETLVALGAIYFGATQLLGSTGSIVALSIGVTAIALGFALQVRGCQKTKSSIEQHDEDEMGNNLSIGEYTIGDNEGAIILIYRDRDDELLKPIEGNGNIKQWYEKHKDSYGRYKPNWHV